MSNIFSSLKPVSPADRYVPPILTRGVPIAESGGKPRFSVDSTFLNLFLAKAWEIAPSLAVERNTQLVGQSSSFLDAVERASRAAPLDRPVLVIGERGTGKELIAERLHHLSSRWDGPLVVMNCAALPETLIEAELFGHEAGAFTGATKARAGRFEEADGGTLFLDELATLSRPAQDRLLRVEYGEVTRIGASPPAHRRRPHRRRDQRGSAAARRAQPLPRRSARPASLRGRHPAAAPPPAERHSGPHRPFRPQMALDIEMDGWPGFSTEAMARIQAYDWPGNVRELRNVVERAVYRWAGLEGPIEDIQFDPFEAPGGRSPGRASCARPPSRRSRPARRCPLCLGRRRRLSSR